MEDIAAFLTRGPRIDVRHLQRFPRAMARLLQCRREYYQSIVPKERARLAVEILLILVKCEQYTVARVRCSSLRAALLEREVRDGTVCQHLPEP
jgi:hypothetical protein